MSILGNNFMQRIFNGGRQASSVLSVTSVIPVIPPPIAQKRFFLLKIIREQDRNAFSPSAVHTLYAGESYVIVITCNENSEQQVQDQLQQQEILIKGTFEIRLECKTECGVLPFDLSYAERLLSFEEAFDDERMLSFSLPKQCPSLNLTFGLSYRQAQRHYASHYDFVVYCTLPVEGTLTPEDPALLEAAYIDTGLPEEAVVLTVMQRRGTSICDVRGWSARQKVLSAELDTESLINITDAMKNQTSPRSIVSSISSFSYSKTGKLAPWLLSLLTSPAKDGTKRTYTVIIFEESDQEIPWELLEIGPGQYLGVVAKVSHWLPIEGYGQKRYLKVVDEQCKGSVLSYLDSQLESVGTEEELLARFTNETLPSLDSLRRRLQRRNGLQQVGLVYLGCHGEGGSMLFSTVSMTERLQNTVNELTALDLTMVRQHSEPLPTFFINACESARLHKENLAILSFVKNMLSRCASNYIGTVAPIGTSFAAAIANHILKLALETQGVQIAELLRLLRAEAVQDLDNYLDQPDSQDEDEIWYFFLFVFLYVYYGNPFARLSLYPAQTEPIMEAQ